MLNTACFMKTLSIPECDLSEQEETFKPQIFYYKKKQRRFDSIFSTRFIGLPCKFKNTSKNVLLTRLRKASQLASSLPPPPPPTMGGWRVEYGVSCDGDRGGVPATDKSGFDYLTQKRLASLWHYSRAGGLNPLPAVDLEWGKPWRDQVVK